jgi:hypothetical protein
MEATLAHILMGMDIATNMVIVMWKGPVVAMITTTNMTTLMTIMNINTMMKMQITTSKSLTSNQ